MQNKLTELNLPEGKFTANLQFFDSSDINALKDIYTKWVQLSDQLQKYGGRRINLPELLSEAIFCINFKAGRVVNSKMPGANSSFDCYEPNNCKRIQVKACSVEEDLTSFGPDSIWDEIYFVHFFPNKKYDGSYNIYLIPNELIYNQKVNSNQTMREQQALNRRPRFSIMKEIIKPRSMMPIIQGSL
jgi:hypothetical protein